MLSKLKSILILTGGIIATIIAIFLKGVSIGKDKQELKQLKNNAKKRKKIKNAKRIDSVDELDKLLQDGKF